LTFLGDVSSAAEDCGETTSKKKKGGRRKKPDLLNPGRDHIIWTPRKRAVLTKDAIKSRVPLSQDPKAQLCWARDAPLKAKPPYTLERHCLMCAEEVKATGVRQSETVKAPLTHIWFFWLNCYQSECSTRMRAPALCVPHLDEMIKCRCQESVRK